jgi:predicted transcriptional regulator
MAQEYLTSSGSSSRSLQQQQLNRRSRMETFCDILRAIGNGAQKPTHIMYKANLSWTVLMEYMKALQSQELVELVDDEGKKTYRLTHKGFQLLNQFLSIREDLNLN